MLTFTRRSTASTGHDDVNEDDIRALVLICLSAGSPARLRCVHTGTCYPMRVNTYA